MDAFSKLMVNGLTMVGIGALAVGTLYVKNYYDHNVQYKDPITKEVVLSQIDGILSHTQFTINDDGKVKIRRTWGNCGDYTVLEDYNGDKSVDRIYTLCTGVRGLDSINLFTKEHFASNSKLVEESNLEFKEQYDRFKPSLDKFLVGQK